MRQDTARTFSGDFSLPVTGQSVVLKRFIPYAEKYRVNKATGSHARVVGVKAAVSPAAVISASWPLVQWM